MFRNNFFTRLFSAASPQTTKVGWIGTGVMGCQMVQHVIRAGYSVSIYNRSKSPTQHLIDIGAKFLESPKQVAQESDVVFVMVNFPHDVAKVVMDRDTGVFAGLKRRGILIDMTTSDPNLARGIAEEADRQGFIALDAPVSGGEIGAKNGTLSVMVGGNSEGLKFCEPILKSFSSSITHFGGPGLGQHCKAANQITVASTMIGFCEGMIYAHKAGLPLEAYLKAIASGAASSQLLKMYAPKILLGDMQPGFNVDHFVKDLSIALHAAQAMQIALPGVALAQQLYCSLQAHDEGKLGIQALIRALERINNCSIPVQPNEIKFF